MISLAPWVQSKTFRIDSTLDRDLFDSDEQAEAAKWMGPHDIVKHVVSFGIFCFQWSVTYKEEFADKASQNQALFLGNDRRELLDSGLVVSGLRYRFGRPYSGYVINGMWNFLIERGVFKAGDFVNGTFMAVNERPNPKYSVLITFAPGAFLDGEDRDYNTVLRRAHVTLEKSLWRLLWTRKLDLTVTE